jgi:ABC-type polysaccharide/polyol phosphate export permease
VIRRLGELWRYRNLVLDLVVLDLKVRYKGSALGFLWSLLNPLLMMAIFTIVFPILLSTPIARFPVFILAALLPWNYFATAVSRGVTSITQNTALINKVYFPSEVFPIATVLAALVNYLLSLPIIFVLMALYQVPLTPALLMLPAIVAIQTLFCLAMALFVAALNVQYRDTSLVMEVLLQAWFFVTPIVYHREQVTSQWLGLYLINIMHWFNPMAAIANFNRDIFYGGLAIMIDGVAPPASPGWPSLLGVGRTGLVVLILVALAYLFFVRRSERFAEEA